MSFRCVVYSSYPKDVKFNGAYGSSRPVAEIAGAGEHRVRLQLIHPGHQG